MLDFMFNFMAFLHADIAGESELGIDLRCDFRDQNRGRHAGSSVWAGAEGNPDAFQALIPSVTVIPPAKDATRFLVQFQLVF